MKKLKWLIPIVLFLFAVGTIGIFIMIEKQGRQSEQTTTTYSATVREVRVNNAERQTSVEIFTEEYENTFLILSNFCSRLHMDEICGLKSGQTVTVRIENDKNRFINQAEFIDVVSLRTEDTTLLSLDEYNRYVKEDAFPAKIACGAVFVLLLAGGLFSVLKIRHKDSQ